MNELNHINGKGDKERSAGWRNNYPEINGFGTATGFTRVDAARIRKTYGKPAHCGIVQCQAAIFPGGIAEAKAVTAERLIRTITTGGLKETTAHALDQLRGPYCPEDCA
jgi:hypothetical protein